MAVAYRDEHRLRWAKGVSLRILIVNWRDLASPWAGGAEVHIQAIAGGLVALGHDVTLLVSQFPGGAPEDFQEGVRVLRRGNRWTANFSLLRETQKELKCCSYDLVIEDINKIPFFTPLLHKLPLVVYVPHLFGGTVFKETNAVSASYIYLMERPIPWVYRQATFIAISQSTADDLVARGVARERVHVVHCGLEFERYDCQEPPPRHPFPTLVHLGRLMRYKSVDVVIRALEKIRQTFPEARLLIIGDGPDQGRLRNLTTKLGLADAVEFMGYLPHERKVDQLWRSHLLLNPSPKEGWGLTVVEANACGLPVIASDAPGLKDSVRDGETGCLVPYGDVDAMAQAATGLLSDEPRYNEFSNRGRKWAASFRWAEAALQTEQIAKKVVHEW